MNQEVSDYIQKIKVDWQAEVCKSIRERVHAAVPEVTERIQYGKPHFLKNGKYAAVLGTAKEWVSFTIFNAEGLQAPSGFFEEGGSPERKTIKIRQGQTPDFDLLSKLL